MNKYKISVIVPVYNVKKYLNRCIESILNQSYTNIEVIIVDDGSTDGSENICDDFILKDSRVKVFHKKNGGLSDARNFGMKHATGNYISFIDSDDYIFKDLLKYQLDIIKKYNADICICDPVHVFNEKVTFEQPSFFKIYNSENAIEEMLYQTSFLVSAWGKLYSKRVLKDIEFPVNKLFEDSAVMYKIFEKADFIVYSNAKYYAYVHRSESITTQKFSKRDFDIIPIVNEIASHYYDTHLQNAAISYKTAACLRILLNTSQEFNSDLILIKCDKYLRKHWKQVLFNKKVRRKEKIGVFLYIFCKPLIRRVYKHVNRWS